MILEKAIRRRQSPLSPEGHHELDSAMTTGAPELSLNPDVQDLLFLEEQVQWPARLDLLVQWRQMPLPVANVTVQDEGLTPKQLYGEKTADKPELAVSSRYGAIVLVCHDPEAEALGIGRQQELYTKAYSYQREGLLSQRRQALGDGNWRITAPISGEVADNQIPLMAYGAYAPQGCNFADIQQTYASIGSSGQETMVRLYCEADLRQQGIIPPGGGVVKGWRYRFVDAPAGNSLIGDIMSQKIQVPITIDGVTRVYVSRAYRAVSENDQIICLTFIPN